jgi:hypothetical protein
MPWVRGPQEFGNSWPAWLVEWEDQLAQLEQEQAERDLAHRQQNRARILPSSVEIARMEKAIAWPMVYLLEIPDLLRAVQVAAVTRARHRDLERAARKMRLAERLLRQRNRDGLDVIALGLHRDRVRVF